MKKILFLAIFLNFLTASDIYATFKIEAKRSANLAFTSGGAIKAMYADVGSVLKKGDVVAELENSDLKAALLSAKIALEHAKRDYNRQLKAKNVLGVSQIDAFKFRFESAKAKYAYQKALLDKTILKAPFDCIVTEKRAEVGDAVPGIQPVTIFRVQSPIERKLKLEFDQKYWKVVKKGLTFRYHIDGDSKEYSGVISKVYPSANAKTRKIFAEVKAKSLPVGLFGDGYIVAPSK